MTINDILTELAYRTEDGCPNLCNPDHLDILESILLEYDIPSELIAETIYNVSSTVFCNYVPPIEIDTDLIEIEQNTTESKSLRENVFTLEEFSHILSADALDLFNANELLLRNSDMLSENKVVSNYLLYKPLLSMEVDDLSKCFGKLSGEFKNEFTELKNNKSGSVTLSQSDRVIAFSPVITENEIKIAINEYRR